MAVPNYAAPMGAPHPLLLPLLRGDPLPSDAAVTDEVVSSAEEHRVAGLITATIEGGDIPIDHDLRARLTASAIASAAEHDSTLAAATSVLAIAADLGIDVAVFKGLAIAHRFYTDPTLRPATDVDVFVAPHHTDRLPTLARALGVEDTSEIEALTSNGSVFEVMAVVDGVAVDIHSDPMNMIVPSKDPEERWSRTISVATPSGSEFRTLDLEDSIIQSLLNSFRDNFADLLHINDLRLMIAARSRLGRGRATCGRQRMDGPDPVCHVVRQRDPWRRISAADVDRPVAQGSDRAHVARRHPATR